jgi:hypothetical protein
VARVAQKHRPRLEHAKGAKVTVPGLQFHGTVVDQHVSYRVARDSGFPEAQPVHILVGENEELPPGTDGTPIDTHVSYLVHRHWDDTDVWIEAGELVAGHVFDAVPALLPAPSTAPFGAR